MPQEVTGRIGEAAAGTVTLTLSTTVSADGFAINAPWKYVRGNVTDLSGTGASVTSTLGV